MYAHLATIAVTAAVAAGGAWQYQSARYERLLAEQRTEYATAQVRALEVAHADTIRLQEAASKAAAAAATRLQRIAADRDRLRGTVDGMRDAADEAIRAAQDSHSACLANARTLRVVFGECAQRRNEVAADAQGHLNDKITLTESWPK